MKHLLTIPALLLALILSSCVAAKKYQEAEQNADKYQRAAEECQVDMTQYKKKVAQLQSDIDALQTQKHALEQDTTLQGMKIETLLNTLAILENDLRLLAAKLGDNPEYQALMRHLMQMQDQLVDSEDKRIDMEKAIADQERALEASRQALDESQRALDAYNAELADKNAELEGKNAELDAARRSIEEQAARLREMEAALRAKEQAMDDLRNMIARALVDFNSDELTVHQKDGKVYVSLEEQLLFASGRYDVNDKGVVALRKIASVLANKTGFDIVVEGHTDNIPYHGQVILDNWDLSVKRATSVLRILIANGEISTSRIQATGRADSSPVDNANTPEARKKNRRTEIILAPNLDQIMSMLGQ